MVNLIRASHEIEIFYTKKKLLELLQKQSKLEPRFFSTWKESAGAPFCEVYHEIYDGTDKAIYQEVKDLEEIFQEVRDQDAPLLRRISSIKRRAWRRTERR